MIDPSVKRIYRKQDLKLIKKFLIYLLYYYLNNNLLRIE